jgi:glycosyltransferase involved in cell wall biosynthesis
MQESKQINDNIALNELTNPLISVITVVFNGEKYLEDTIKSIVYQKSANIEYIVIDGGSSDGTLGIINKYKSRIDHFISEPDEGIYDAMNKGALLANGKYICFLNASDIYFKDALLKIINKALKNNFDYFVAPAVIRDENNQDLRIQYPLNNFVYQKGKYMEMLAPHLSVFVKKTIFLELGGYDLNFKISSDYDFLLRLAEKYKNISYGNEPIGAFRLGGLSSSYKIYFENFNIGVKHDVPILKMALITSWYLFRNSLKRTLPNKIIKILSKN